MIKTGLAETHLTPGRRRKLGSVVVACLTVATLSLVLSVSGCSSAPGSPDLAPQTPEVVETELLLPDSLDNEGQPGPISTELPEVPHGTTVEIGDEITTTVTGPGATASIPKNSDGSQAVPAPTKTNAPARTTIKPPTSSSPTTSGVGYCTPAEPKVWASCTQGYTAPTIEFAGVVSCRAVDRQAGNWDVTIRLALAGGNYRAAEWSGPNQDGTMTITVMNMPESILGEEVGLQLNIDVFIKSMDGYPGNIDKLFRSWRQPIIPASYCS